jgi:hypothetical protein
MSTAESNTPGSPIRDAGGPAAGVPATCTREPCPAASTVTVAITLSAAVACPGHPLEMTANGSPSGGTYAWSVSGGGAQLVDGAGNTATTGPTLYLRSFQPDNTAGNIPAQTATVQVTYTHSSGTATDSKRVPIHKIDFAVTQFTPHRGGFFAHESAAGVKIWNIFPKSVFRVDPKVKIVLDSACPRQAACGSNHRVGWLQTMLTDVRQVKYPTLLYYVDCSMPIRDAWHDTLQPFYDGTFVKTFTGNNDQQSVHHEDSPSYPGGPAPWTDAAGGGGLQTVTLKNSFTAWLVVQNIEWFNKFGAADSFVYLKHIDWRCELVSNIDLTKAIGSRANPASANTTTANTGTGKGSSPILSAPIFNTSATVRTIP